MQRIQGGRGSNIVSDRMRKAVPNMESLGGTQRSGSPYRMSQSPRGVNGNLERIKQIQAQLRAPMKKKP